METITALDKKILSELDRDARQSISDLSRKVRHGRDTVEYRVARLEQKGIITRYSAIINPYNLGLAVYKTYLKLENRRSKLDAFMAYLNAHPRVYWIAESDGRWDFMFSVFATSPYEFFDLQNQILNQFGEIVISFDVFTLVRLSVFSRGYFGTTSKESRVIGGPPCLYRLSEQEFAVLKILAENARMSTSAIAEQVDLSPSAVTRRIKQLEENNIIVGYRLDLNLSKLGMTFFKAQLYLRKYQDKEIAKLRAYCAEHPHITYFIEQLGECKLEVELEVKDYEQFLSIVREIRAKHCGLIRNIETNLVSKELFNWIPRGIRLYSSSSSVVG